MFDLYLEPVTAPFEAVKKTRKNKLLYPTAVMTVRPSVVKSAHALAAVHIVVGHVIKPSQFTEVEPKVNELKRKLKGEELSL